MVVIDFSRHDVVHRSRVELATGLYGESAQSAGKTADFHTQSIATAARSLGTAVCRLKPLTTFAHPETNPRSVETDIVLLEIGIAPLEMNENCLETRINSSEISANCLETSIEVLEMSANCSETSIKVLETNANCLETSILNPEMAASNPETPLLPPLTTGLRPSP